MLLMSCFGSGLVSFLLVVQTIEIKIVMPLSFVKTTIEPACLKNVSIGVAKLCLILSLNSAV